MINPATIRLIAYGAAVLAIFLMGFRANGYLWSAKYDRLEAAHVTAVAEARQRSMTRQELINEETQGRETILLHELEIQREQYDELEASIAATPLVRDRIVLETVEGDCPAVPVVDWSAFGRLYDSASSSRPAAETDAADRGDAAVAGTSETG